MENQKPIILLVEDNSENREVMMHFLRKICDVEIANDGPGAIESAKNNDFAAILMDINLGLGMNGVEATKKIRSLENHKNTPIVAVTAYAMAGDRETFLASGCNYYISKPFTKKEFVSLIEKVLIESGALTIN